MQVCVFLLALAGLGQASWWIFGGGGAKTETPAELVTTISESQEGPTLGTGEEIPELSLEVPEILHTEPLSETRAETVQSVELQSETIVEPSTATASVAESKPQGSYWSFWPFASKPAEPDLTIGQFFEIDDEKPAETFLDPSVHFDADDAELYEDTTAFTKPTTLNGSPEVSEDKEPRKKVPIAVNNSDEKPEDVFCMDSVFTEDPEPTYFHRRVKQPAIKSIVLSKTASLETLARNFDALITDSHIARYYFTRMTPLLQKRVKSLAALYNFSLINESGRTVTVKRNKMGQFPNYDKVADLLEADERERTSSLSSHAYFNGRQASPVDEVESVPLNKKGPLTITVTPSPANVNDQKAWKKRAGARLRNRQRKLKLAEQNPSSEEPIVTEQPQTSHESSSSYYEFEPVDDNADDYDSDSYSDSDGSFFADKKPVENVWRFDLSDNHHRHYDGSQGESDQSWDEESSQKEDYDYEDYNSYYDDADYYQDIFELKMKSRPLFSTF